MSIGKPLPGLDVPIVDPKTGLMTQTWYEYFQSRHKISLSQLEDISTTAPLNTQVLVWLTATNKWTPAAN